MVLLLTQVRLVPVYVCRGNSWTQSQLQCKVSARALDAFQQAAMEIVLKQSKLTLNTDGFQASVPHEKNDGCIDLNLHNEV